MKNNAEIEALFLRRTGDIRPGLDRIKAAWEFLGRPGSCTPTLLVGGTNGKGTVCGYSYHLLALMGLRVGLFTSPHLCHFRERIQVSDVLTSDSDIVGGLTTLKSDLPPEVFDSLSFFEISTLIALRLFDAAKTAVNVLEVGLGGRWDSTNVIDADIAAVVSVGMDHMQFLGDSVEKIALEKVAIARPNSPLYWGGQASGGDSAQADRAEKVIADYCKHNQVDLVSVGSGFGLVDDEWVEVKRPKASAWRGRIPSYFAQAAPFQKANFALAAAMIRGFFKRADGSFLALSHLKTREAFDQAWEMAWAKFGTTVAPMGPSVLGRFQNISVSVADVPNHKNEMKPLLLDVCHNIDGVLALKQALQRRFGASIPAPVRLPGLVSILGDKDLTGILDLLQGFLSPIVLFKIPNDRSFRRNQLADRHKQWSFFESFPEAFAFTLKNWEANRGPWVVCGSLAAVGEVLSVFDAVPDKFTVHRELKGSWRGIPVG